MTPDVSRADLRATVRGNTAFALDLYQRLRRSEDGNIVVSPYSISVAFAMQHAGAREQTAREIEEVLHFTLRTQRLDAAFDRLALALDSRQNRQVKLSIANRLFGAQLLPFRTSFLRELTRHFAAPMAAVDFAGRPEAARRLINRWVARQTADRIRELIGERQITRRTQLVIVNAIYLNARWSTRFLTQRTSDQRFVRLDDTRVNVPTMHHDGWMASARTDDYVAVELPYRGDKLAMLLVMPTPGTFPRFERSLDPSVLADVVRALRGRGTMLALPKFSIRTSLDLGATLQRMGMKDAFDRDVADLYDMTTIPPGQLPRLFIAKVLHQAFLSVTERGTEAGAATAIIDEGATGGMEGYVQATFDHPFLWFIRDRVTGTVLFMGRVVDPSVRAS
jgi:serpin B